MIPIEKIGQHQIVLQRLVRTVFFIAERVKKKKKTYLTSPVRTGSEKAQPA